METKKTILWPFWLEMALVSFLLFTVWWATTPTNVLNSEPLWKALEWVGLFGHGIAFWGCPIGIVGLRAAKKMVKLRTVTRVLAVVNLVIGSLLVSLWIMAFSAVLFGQATH